MRSNKGVRASGRAYSTSGAPGINHLEVPVTTSWALSKAHHLWRILIVLKPSTCARCAGTTTASKNLPGDWWRRSDEVTYNLHIVIRFELERKLLDGDLAAADLPGAWNDLYQRYIGITPPDDHTGCLQDIHWADGPIGYFPTYTLGNIFAAQIFAAAERAIGPLEDAFAVGDFGVLRAWLAENIHRHGMRYRSEEIIERVTGNSPEPSALTESLSKRYRAKAGALAGLPTP